MQIGQSFKELIMGTLTLASSSGSISLTPETAGGSAVLTLPAITGTVLAASAPTASVDNIVTNKVAIEINGVTYYLLASTSAA